MLVTRRRPGLVRPEMAAAARNGGFRVGALVISIESHAR
jgi:hypothetical protein